MREQAGDHDQVEPLGPVKIARVMHRRPAANAKLLDAELDGVLVDVRNKHIIRGKALHDMPEVSAVAAREFHDLDLVGPAREPPARNLLDCTREVAAQLIIQHPAPDGRRTMVVRNKYISSSAWIVSFTAIGARRRIFL